MATPFSMLHKGTPSKIWDDAFWCGPTALVMQCAGPRATEKIAVSCLATCQTFNLCRSMHLKACHELHHFTAFNA